MYMYDFNTRTRCTDHAAGNADRAKSLRKEHVANVSSEEKELSGLIKTRRHHLSNSSEEEERQVSKKKLG